jgi:NAD(P)-dependent dehydrogenase (short-subunit alcohol dehydrogenase family)
MVCPIPPFFMQSILHVAESSSTLNKMAQPMEVANAVLYLARDATHTTGDILDVSGGSKLYKTYGKVSSAASRGGR